MQLIVVSIFDTATRTYARPVFVAARGAALRSFSDEVNTPREDNPLNRHPGDFELHLLGTWDDQNGAFASLPQPELLVRGVDVKELKS